MKVPKEKMWIVLVIGCAVGALIYNDPQGREVLEYGFMVIVVLLFSICLLRS